ncbi:hypothetical protein QEN19_000125 [Hanseniaspora menglaensis]
MFTGIVETTGTLKNIHNDRNNFEVTVQVENHEIFLSDCQIGDSISCSGICLTVIEFDAKENWFKLGISVETLRRTTIEKMWTNAGDSINLERAMGSGNHRFGGHYVQGHVDTIAEIIAADEEGDSVNFKYKLRDLEYTKYIVEKGYLTVDGASLTVTFVDDNLGVFGVSMIKHTREVLAKRPIGSFVNIEVDLTGKMIAKQVELYMNKFTK